MTVLGTITNVDNVRCRYVRSLQSRKRVRYRDRRYVVEGLRSVSHAVSAGQRPFFLFYSSSFAAAPGGKELLAGVSSDVQSWMVSDEVLTVLTDTVTPQGVLAVLDMPQTSPADACQADLLLILDNIRDPGNLGTILRTAEATGTGAVVLSRGCADPYAPKVVRAGMGAQMRLSIMCGASWGQIERLVSGKQCVLADAQAPQVYWEYDWTAPTALVVGSEAHGASAQARALVAQSIRLPMTEGVESLNAAIATAVLLFEAQRQRLLARQGQSRTLPSA